MGESLGRLASMWHAKDSLRCRLENLELWLALNQPGVLRAFGYGVTSSATASMGEPVQCWPVVERMGHAYVVVNGHEVQLPDGIV